MLKYGTSMLKFGYCSQFSEPARSRAVPIKQILRLKPMHPLMHVCPKR